MKYYFRPVCTQIYYLISSKGAVITFTLLLGLVLMNYLGNVGEFKGYDVVNMYHPMKMLLLSYNHTYYSSSLALVLVQLIPLIVCLPAGLSLVTEQHNGVAALTVSRIGARKYIWSKVTAVFIVNFIVFTVPFLIEIVLNCLSFPLNSVGDFTNWSAYSPETLERVESYAFSGLYTLSPYLYAVFCTLFLGAFTGLLSAATVAISALWKPKYKVSLILPVFLFLQATLYLGSGAGWHNYIMLFNEQHRYPQVACLLMLLVALFTVFGAERFARKDTL